MTIYRFEAIDGIRYSTQAPAKSIDCIRLEGEVIGSEKGLLKVLVDGRKVEIITP